MRIAHTPLTDAKKITPRAQPQVTCHSLCESHTGINLKHQSIQAISAAGHREHDHYRTALKNIQRGAKTKVSVMLIILR